MDKPVHPAKNDSLFTHEQKRKYDKLYKAWKKSQPKDPIFPGFIDRVLTEVVKICDSHKPKNMILGYIRWHDWADKQEKAGNKQVKCPVCGLYFYPCEL